MIYNENYQNFLGIWDYWLTILAYTALGIFVLLTINYYVRLLMKSDAKGKYDYINENEIKLFLEINVNSNRCRRVDFEHKYIIFS